MTEPASASLTDTEPRRGGPDASTADGRDTAERGRPRPAGTDGPAIVWLARLAVAAAVLPVVVSCVRAVSGGWRAIGEDALFGLRATDVLTRHHPLLGLSSSVSQVVGHDVNHPGPLMFDALAIPVRIGGPNAGVACGIALLNVTAVLGIAIVARRMGGAAAVVVAMAGAAGLGWSMGSALVIDPWPPNSLLFPFLCFLFLVWGLAAGDAWLLPWAVVVGSLVTQTHVGYMTLVPVVGAWGLAAGGWRLWRVRGAAPAGPTVWRRVRRPLVIAAVVAIVCWWQPLAEQFFVGERGGNLGALVTSIGDTGESLGAVDGTRLVADVVALPPWWGRSSLRQVFAEGDPQPSLTASVAALALVVLVLVVDRRSAARRGSAPAEAAAATGILLMGASVVAAALTPLGVFDRPGHQLLWLWPIAIFVMFAAVYPWMGVLRPPARLPVVGLLAGAVITLAALNLPSMNAGIGPAGAADTIPTARTLLPQLSSLRGEPGLLVDVSDEPFAAPYTMPVMAELTRLGVPLYVDDPTFVRQVGRSRQYEGQSVPRLFVRMGNGAREDVTGARRVAFVDGLSDAEHAELSSLEELLGPFIAAGGLVGRVPASAPGVPDLTTAQLRDPGYLVGTRALVALGSADGLDVPRRWRVALARYADLQRRNDQHTAAVFVAPAPH